MFYRLPTPPPLATPMPMPSKAVVITEIKLKQNKRKIVFCFSRELLSRQHSIYNNNAEC